LCTPCNDTPIPMDTTGKTTITATPINSGSSDACRIASTSVSYTTLSRSNVGSNPVTLTVTDVNGNPQTCNTTVTVADNTPPTVNCKPKTVNLDSTGHASIVPADVYLSGSDNCSTVNLVSVNPNSFNCANLGPNTVTLTVNDGHGNQNTCTATVTVADNTPPTVTCPANIIKSADSGVCGAAVAVPTPTGVGDNCGVASVVNDFTGTGDA